MVLDACMVGHVDGNDVELLCLDPTARRHHDTDAVLSTDLRKAEPVEVAQRQGVSAAGAGLGAGASHRRVHPCRRGDRGTTDHVDTAVEMFEAAGPQPPINLALGAAERSQLRPGDQRTMLAGVRPHGAGRYAMWTPCGSYPEPGNPSAPELWKTTAALAWPR